MSVSVSELPAMQSDVAVVVLVTGPRHLAVLPTIHQYQLAYVNNLQHFAASQHVHSQNLNILRLRSIPLLVESSWQPLQILGPASPACSYLKLKYQCHYLVNTLTLSWDFAPYSQSPTPMIPNQLVI